MQQNLLIKRLNLLNDMRGLAPTEIISRLRSNRVVSLNYSEKCLAVDWWYLNRKPNKLKFKDYTNCSSVDDFPSNVMLRIVIRALMDVASGRPCDLGAWKMDAPPDGLRCFREEHICSAHAEEYLLDLTPEEQIFCGLKPEFLRGFIRAIKRKIPESSHYNLDSMNTLQSSR